MLRSFHSLPEDSRIWIFQSNQFLSPQQINSINFELNRLLGSWISHQESLHAGFIILHDLFVIIGLDQNQTASGCSIDAMMHAVQRIEKKIGGTLLDRTHVAFQSNGKIRIVQLNEFQELIKKNEINQSTQVFNNLISSKKELLTHWKVSIEKSWHNRYLT
ncbi:MAG: ABC transporter ATPase [Flavobacteriaceae bacterium]|nr:ABC transporter ATPase [Flavobacteriaceae bacterium]MCY4266481.1 ABC transporter ATPase [Flavobacteriaceae bacterium]